MCGVKGKDSWVDEGSQWEWKNRSSQCDETQFAEIQNRIIIVLNKDYERRVKKRQRAT